MEILLMLFAVSVPIVYIYGLVSFFSNYGKPSRSEITQKYEWRLKDAITAKNKLEEKVKTLERDLTDERNIIKDVLKYAKDFPDMRLAALMQVLFPSEAEAPVAETAPVAPLELPQVETPAVMEDLLNLLTETPDEAEATPTHGVVAASAHIEAAPQIVAEVPSLASVLATPNAQVSKPSAILREVAEPKYIQAEVAPQPSFNWGNWFSDNAINLMLFVGAFLVVAAVSFFMWSQWGNFDGGTKFALVLTFTAAWYAAGMLFNRGESFKTVGITFITIGAILTPFVGVGYHQFLLGGDPNSIGMIWLLTSVFASVIYTILSLVFHRRYFTYFGTLSILAMLLSLVQVTEVPQTYFILAGAVTALILLVGRATLRFFPSLDNYMGQDYEYSSVGTLLLSLGFGMGIVLLSGEPPFFSVDVFAVGLVATIYLWVYASLHTEDYYLFAAQILSVLMLGHGVYSLSANPMTALLACFAAQFALQVILHFALRHDSERQRDMHFISLVLGALAYALSIALPQTSLEHYLVAVMALVLMMQFSFFARRYNRPMLYYLCVTLSYAALAHALLGVGLDLAYWGFAFVTLGLLETLAASFVRDEHLRRAQLGLSLGIMVASGFVAISTLLNRNASPDYLNAFGTAYAALFGFALISLIEEKRSYKLLPPSIHIGSAFVALAYFIYSLVLVIQTSTESTHFYAVAALGLAASGTFYLAYRQQREAVLMVAAALNLYPTLATILYALGMPYATWGTAFVTLAALQIGVAYLPLEKTLRQGIAYLGLVALAVFSFAYLMSFPTDSLVIGTSFAALGIYIILSGYELSRPERFFERAAHTIGIATALAMIVFGNWQSFAPFTLLGYSLALLGNLALFYRHAPKLPAMMSLAVGSNLVLWFLLQSLGISQVLPYFLALAAIQLGFAYLPVFQAENRRAVATVGIWSMVIFLSIAAVLGHPAANQMSLSLILVWLGLAYLAIFEESQNRRENPIIDSFSRQLPIIAAAIAYAVSLSYNSEFMSLAYAFGLLYFLLSNYRHSMEKSWLFAGVVLLYLISKHALLGFGIDFIYWGMAYVALSSILSFAIFTPFFSEQSRRVLTYTGIAGLSLSILACFVPHSIYPFATAYSESIQSTFLLTGLGGIIIFAVFAWLEKRGERILDPNVHYIPMLLAAVGAVVSYPLLQAPLTLGYALALLYFLLSNYRQSSNPLWLFAGMFLLYPIAVYSLWTADVPTLYWTPSLIALAAAQSLMLYTPFFDEGTRKGITGIGILGLILLSLYALYPIKGNTADYRFDNFAVLGAILVLALISYLELGQTEKRLPLIVHTFGIGLAFIAYLSNFVSAFFFPFMLRYDATIFLISLPLLFSLACYLAYRHIGHLSFLFGMTLAFYPALLHSLLYLEVPVEFYPVAIALLSLGLYLPRKAIVGESGAGVMSFIILLILGITSISPYFFGLSADYQVFSWAASYSFLLIFWHSRIIEIRQAREFILLGIVYLQYLMHLDFAIRHTAFAATFSDMQWFSAGLALVLLIFTLRESHFNENRLPMPMFYLTSAVALLPSYYQSIVSQDSIIYPFLGIVYGLALMAVGILYRNRLASSVGVLGVIVAVLIPTGKYILDQPWWVILLTIGLLLIVVSIILTTLRRNGKKAPVKA